MEEVFGNIDGWGIVCRGVAAGEAGIAGGGDECQCREKYTDLQ